MELEKDNIGVTVLVEDKVINDHIYVTLHEDTTVRDESVSANLNKAQALKLANHLIKVFAEYDKPDVIDYIPREQYHLLTVQVGESIGNIAIRTSLSDWALANREKPAAILQSWEITKAEYQKLNIKTT